HQDRREAGAADRDPGPGLCEARRGEGGQGAVRPGRAADHGEHLHRRAVDLIPSGTGPGRTAERTAPIATASQAATAIHTSTSPRPSSHSASTTADADSAAVAVIPSGNTVDQRRGS